MNDGKLRSRPPLANSNVEDFIGGAGEHPDQSQQAALQETEKVANSEREPLPWEAPGVREDVNKVFNLRLSEPHLLKLKYIAEHTPDSMQQFCLDVLLPAIDAKIKEITGQR